MKQLENIESIEKELWESADTLRSNSNFASNEYFLPIMGFIFLRHAYSRFLNVKKEIEKSLPSRGGKVRPLTKEDFSGRGALFLREESQFEYLVHSKREESLSEMIVNVIQPLNGIVFDPACGTGGMFVQSAHFVEQQKRNANKILTFKGQEKNETTIRLAKMNLAVHGLEGSISQGITYYQDKHELLGKADFVMANPPFNVDEIDADKVRTDPRLPFGIPGINQKKKVSNGNYVWISYFYSY